MTAGNSKGLLVPASTTEDELEILRARLPADVTVQPVHERLSALGNCIACNDSVALIHPDLSEETEKIIAETLEVEVIRTTINNHPLVGTYCVLTN